MAKVITFTDLSTPTNLTATTVSGGSLDASTTYYYKVFAVFSNASLNSQYFYENGRSLCSIEVSATTDATNKSIKLDWDAVSGAGGYRIYRCKGESLDTTTTKLSTTLEVALTTNTYTDNGSAVQHTYGTIYWDYPHGKLELTGGTSADPITINDIYNADVAGGWGMIHKLSAKCYEINIPYILANAFIKFSGNAVLLVNGLFSGSSLGTSLQIGERNSTYDATYDGCVISFKCANFGGYRAMNGFYKLIYDTTFIYDYYSYRGWPYTGSNQYAAFDFSTGDYCQDVTFKNFRYVGAAGTSVMKEIRLIDGSENMWNWSTTGQIRNIQVEDAGIQVQYSLTSAFAPIIDQLILKKNGYLNFYNNHCAVTVRNTLLNATMGWYTSPDASWHEEFNFDMLIVDDNGDPIENATISLKNNLGTEVYSGTTDSSGVITTQYILTRVFSYGNAVADPTNAVSKTLTNITDYNPFTITVSKTGYETYESVMDITAKLNSTITLKPIVPIRQTLDGELLLANQPETGSSAKLLKI